MEGIIVLAVVALLALLVITFIITRFLYICHPNEVVILSGRKRSLPDGSEVGYRVIRGGRALRIPFIEKAARISLETLPIDLAVQNAYSKGGIPLKVEAIANVKIDSTEPTFGNAVERFLGKSMNDMHEIIRDTLEGNLRGVLALLTPEEVNEDRLKFASELIEEADQDLKQLGFQLDTLKITNISDDAGYLDSIGRRKTAEVLASARKAEAEKQAEAEEIEALSRQQAETAKARSEQAIREAQIQKERNITLAEARSQQDVEIERAKVASMARKAEAEQQAEAEAAEAIARQHAETAKVKSDEAIRTANIEKNRNVSVNETQAQRVVEEEKNALRVLKANLEKDAVIREKEALVAGQRAQVKFEQEVEQERIVLQQRKLAADIIEPAKASKEAAELEAKGMAASITETGKAKLEVVQMMISAYERAGSDAERIFVLNMLPDLVKQITGTVGNVKIDKLSVIDGGGSSDSGLGRVVNQLPSAVLTLTETIQNTTGINILDYLKPQGTTSATPSLPQAVEEQKES